MFTGIIESFADVTGFQPQPPGARLIVATNADFENVKIGDSVAINGCCLTVVEYDKAALQFEVGPETLSRTNLGKLSSASQVNLERSMQLGDRLDGHLVTGHVDGLGLLDERLDTEEWSTFWFRVPSRLTRQMASKGSVAVDGVSLTLVEVELERFSVALIPHTLKVTTLGALQPGDEVNIETDLLAKYVERHLATQGT